MTAAVQSYPSRTVAFKRCWDGRGRRRPGNPLLRDSDQRQTHQQRFSAISSVCGAALGRGPCAGLGQGLAQGLAQGKARPGAWLRYGSAKTNIWFADAGFSSGVSLPTPPETSDGPVLTATYCFPFTAKVMG